MELIFAISGWILIIDDLSYVEVYPGVLTSVVLFKSGNILEYNSAPDSNDFFNAVKISTQIDFSYTHSLYDIL